MLGDLTSAQKIILHKNMESFIVISEFFTSGLRGVHGESWEEEKRGLLTWWVRNKSRPINQKVLTLKVQARILTGWLLGDFITELSKDAQTCLGRNDLSFWMSEINKTPPALRFLAKSSNKKDNYLLRPEI